MREPAYVKALLLYTKKCYLRAYYFQILKSKPTDASTCLHLRSAHPTERLRPKESTQPHINGPSKTKSQQPRIHGGHGTQTSSQLRDEKISLHPQTSSLLDTGSPSQLKAPHTPNLFQSCFSRASFLACSSISTEGKMEKEDTVGTVCTWGESG